MKLCKKCGLEKPETEFKAQRHRMSPENPRGIASPCKQCDARTMVVWREKNRNRCLEKAREWTEKNPHARKKSHLKCAYGLSLEEYGRMKNEQGGACAICQKIPKGSLCVDHCHKTGKVRALLCCRCNITLGYFEASDKFFQLAVVYLKKHAP